MRKRPTKRIEHFRIRTGPLATDESDGANGAFLVSLDGVLLKVLVSDGRDWYKSDLPGTPWEHVSVSVETRRPTWSEMNAIKRLLWADHETVMQLHVPRQHHINCHPFCLHPFCLHLWRPYSPEIPLPPDACV